MTSQELITVPLATTSQGKRKIQICYVAGRFFASKSDSDYLEKEARICVNRNPTEDSAPSCSSTQKNWHQNSNLLPIMDELVACLVEFGLADVFRIGGISSSDATSSSSSEGGGGIGKRLLRIEEIPFEDTKEFRTRRLVVRDFWRKGFFIADGTRFGGNFLVYTSSPNQCHAEFVLLCTPITDSQRISAMRCCNQVKKTLILATTSSDSNNPHYTKCEWFRPELF